MRVRVVDPKSRWYGYSGWRIGDEVYLDARPIGAPAINKFPPVFRPNQLATTRPDRKGGAVAANPA